MRVSEEVLESSDVLRTEGGNEARGGTNIDGVDVGLVERVHVALGEESVGKERQQDELGEGEELIAGEGEAGASAGC
jgi:hypothetical protein